MNPGWRKDYLRYKAYLLNVIGHYKRRKDLKLYLEIFLSLATISIFAMFALRPTVLTIAELIKEIEAKKIAIAAMDQKILNISTAQETYATQKNNIDLLENAIPSSPKPEDYERQIENLAVKNGVALISVSIDEVKLLGSNPKPKEEEVAEEVETEINVDAKPAPEETNYEILTTSLSVEGSYQSINQFVADTIDLLRPINIESLNINTSRSNENSGLLSLSLSMEVPFISEK